MEQWDGRPFPTPSVVAPNLAGRVGRMPTSAPCVHQSGHPPQGSEGPSPRNERLVNVLELVDEDDPRYCPHFGDGTQKVSCSKCNGLEEARRKQRDAVKRQFPSIYGGTCPLCQGAFEVGELIFELADGRYTCCQPGT